MEWCRMYALRIFVWIWFLGSSFSIALPDMSEREQKRLELLKSLGLYKPDSHPITPPTNSISNSDILKKASSCVQPPESLHRISSATMDKSPLFNEDSIQSYEDFYRIMYGTQEGVNLLRKKYGPTGLPLARAKYGVNKGFDDLKLANQHYLKIRKEARCRVPKPQIVRVKDYYPDISREYIPRCTILHRCGDTTGCCESDAFHCVAIAVQEVTLHFYTLSVGRDGQTRTDNRIEKLFFQNHTSCQCQPVNDLPRMQDGPDRPLAGKPLSTSNSKCNDCPVPFTSRIYKDGRCGCDCFDRQRPCIRIKRGKEPLSDIERRCVESNHCHIPECEHGSYNVDTGFCPKRHDEQSHHHKRPNHPSHNHRWGFIERD